MRHLGSSPTMSFGSQLISSCGGWWRVVAIGSLERGAVCMYSSINYLEHISPLPRHSFPGIWKGVEKSAVRTPSAGGITALMRAAKCSSKPLMEVLPPPPVFLVMSLNLGVWRIFFGEDGVSYKSQYYDHMSLSSRFCFFWSRKSASQTNLTLQIRIAGSNKPAGHEKKDRNKQKTYYRKHK